jgi:hypothetical protein
VVKPQKKKSKKEKERMKGTIPSKLYYGMANFLCYSACCSQEQLVPALFYEQNIKGSPITEKKASPPTHHC